MKRSPKTAIVGDREITERRSPWQLTNGQFIAGQAAVDEADLVAAQMEREWGAGRLRLLVGPELRERFDRQRYLLNRAIWHGDLEEVRRESKRMVAAWRALDQAARAAGATTAAPEVWELTLEDGTVAAIVRDEHDASRVNRDGRAVAVYTLPEIARLLSGFPALARAKEVWDGASVVAVRQVGDALDGIHDSSPKLDDEIPF